MGYPVVVINHPQPSKSSINPSTATTSANLTLSDSTHSHPRLNLANQPGPHDRPTNLPTFDTCLALHPSLQRASLLDFPRAIVPTRKKISKKIQVLADLIAGFASTQNSITAQRLCILLVSYTFFFLRFWIAYILHTYLLGCFSLLFLSRPFSVSLSFLWSILNGPG